MRDEPLTASTSEREAEYPPRKAQLKEHRSVLHRWTKQAMLGNWEVVWERLGHQGGSLGKGTELQEERKLGEKQASSSGLERSKQPLGIWLELSVNGRGRYGLEVMNTRVEITLRLPDLAMT